MSNGYRTLSQHLNDLKKENFSLKLRIYFLEERMQQKYEASRDDVYRRNIELKVEVESLKQELQEKQQNLDRAWEAAERLSGQNEAESCHQQESERAYEILEKKIYLLQEEAQSARTEAEQMKAVVEAGKERCLELTKQLAECSRKQDESRESQALLDTHSVILAEKDKRIGELTWQLSDKEQLLTLLSKEKESLRNRLDKILEMEVQYSWEDHQQLTWCDSSVDKQASELKSAELLEKIHHIDADNKLLQDKLNEMDFELKSVQQTSQRQDHRIQNLNETLKSKETESEELYRVIEGQNETITKLQDMLHRSQLGQLQVSESSSSSQQKQQMALLEMQSTLFLTQLEVQQTKRAEQRKDRQMAEERKTSQLLQTWLQEEQQQKEAAWKHNWELRAVLQQLQAKLQNKNGQCWTLEREKCSSIKRKEQKIKQLNYCLAYKEQLLQEFKELLQYHQNLDKSPTSAAADMVQKLQQRIRDRDDALEQAVDEKFHLLEEREQELQQLRWSLREREHDLEDLRRVLSNNETTIQGLESMLKAKGLELEQLSAACQNFQWLKEEAEAKSQRWQVEQEGIIQQLWTTLHDRSQEVEALSAALQGKLGPGQRDIVEELCFRLQQKEQIIQELLRDKNQQAEEQKAEVQSLLQAMSTKQQQSRLSSEKMAQALIERSSELQVLRQQLMGQIPGHRAEGAPAQLPLKGQSVEALMQGKSDENITTTIPKRENDTSKEEKDLSESTAGLEKELSNVKDELELLTRKERESRLELSALQSVVVSQEEELQVQASDVESLTRNIQIKEELIKDLQMQLVDPEEMPAMERLTQEVLMLREKVAQRESQGQEVTGNRKQLLLRLLEELAAEKNQLNEALQREKQLYSTLVKFHAHPDSTGREQTLQVELEGAQALHKRLEEALGRTLERLLRLDSLDTNGVLNVTEDAEDSSTEFTDSIEEEAAADRAAQQQQSMKKDAADILVGHSSCPAPVSSAPERNLQEELLHARCENQQVLEQKKQLEEELQDLKRQIEDAGFSSVSHFRKALLSLCLENAELKEQIGEATLSEGWENEDEKEDEKDLRPEVRKLPEKLNTSDSVPGLPREPLTLSSQGGKGKPHVMASMAEKSQQLQMAKGLLPKNDPQRHHLQSPGMDSGAVHHSAETQVHSLARDFWQQFMEPAQQLRSELTQCRQQCHDLQEKLVTSEAAVQARMVQLEQYQALLTGEPGVQQDNKQIQVDLQDLGYETCGKSENEADREEATSPECEEDNIFNENPESWRKLLGSLPNKLAKQDAFLGCSQYNDNSVLCQPAQNSTTQLQSSGRTVQNPVGHGRSMSTTSDYASGAEHPLKLNQDYTLGSSPSHSMTDEDEGWHSDSLGTLCPRSLQSSKDLIRLIRRVSLLEAQIDGAKPEELKRTASLGPRKYDSLVQAQARELSHLRQVLREGQGVGHMLSQLFGDAIKSFEELLRGTDIDYFLGQSFREQLAQGNQLAGRLARKLSSRSGLNMEDKSDHELLALRLSKKLQEKEQIIENLQAKLQSPVTPSSSHTISEPRSSSSSTSFLSDGLEGCSDMEDAGEYQENPSKGPPYRVLDTDLGSRSEEASAPPSHLAPAALPESVQKNFSLPPSPHPSQMPGQSSAGFHPDSLSKPSSSLRASFDSGPDSVQPLGYPPASAPLLGCCGPPGFSLANAQQELQVLQKQLEESVSFHATSPAKLTLPAGLFPPGSPAFSSRHCLQADHRVPQSFPMQNSANWIRKAGEALRDTMDARNMTHFREPQKGLVCGSLPPCPSACLTGPKSSDASLLQEHLADIQLLGQRLAESISTNNRLREQLEASLISVAKSNEWMLLQEALLASHSKLQDGEMELEQQRTEQQRLREEIRGKQQDLVQLQEECLTLQKNNSRLQHRVVLLQQQCEENQLLFQALQAELRVCEVPYGSLQRADLDMACHRDDRSKGPPPSIGGGLLPEVRALRSQLVHAVQVNCVLRQKLEQQQYHPGATTTLQGLDLSSSVSRWQHSQDSTLSPPVRDVGMKSSPPLFPLIPFSPSVLQANQEAQGIHPEDDLGLKNDNRTLGAHAVSHVENYSALKQQILEGKILTCKMASFLKSGLETQDSRVLHPGGLRQLLANTDSLHQILEKVASLLSLFWIAVLPVPRIAAQTQQAEQSMKEEIRVLRAKLAEQESRLQNASHYKDSIENFLLAHLTRTHAVLKRARTNLEGMSELAMLSSLSEHVLA